VDRRRALQLFVGGISALPSLSALSLVQRAALADELHAKLNPPGTAYVPRALDARQFELVTRIADLILPATDTPGAKAAGVHEFIDLLLAESLLEPDRKALIGGLAMIDEKCRGSHGAPFLDSSEANQIAVLAALDADASTITIPPAHLAANAAIGAARPATAASAARAFATLKQLTLHGYFNSEVVTKLLHVPVVPGRFQGCVPIQSV
jgi:hypothetical protein